MTRTRALLAALALLVVLGGVATLQVRTRMSAARLGSDVYYTIDANGDARVEVVDKTYFVDPETGKNFDGLVARLGKPDPETFRTAVEKNVKSVADKTGRSGMGVSDFETGFDRQADYGAQIYRFRWTAFAANSNGIWVVAFRQADQMKLTKDSSITIVLPPGALLVKVEPEPSAPSTGTKLMWSGAGLMAWPYVEYR